MSAAPPDERARRGAALFAARHPAAWSRLEAIGATVTRRIDVGGAVVNIDLGEGRRLYPEDAAVWTARQTAAYFADPDRLRLEAPPPATLSPGTRELAGDIDRMAGDAPAPRPVADIGFAFVFGIGLGLHLPDLVRRTACRHLVLIEPVAEFLRHSLSAVDWDDLAGAADAAGMAVHLILESDPAAILRDIEAIVLGSGGRAFLDGSWAYVHYASWPLNQARSSLNDRLPDLQVRPGHLEDEGLMLANAYGNMLRWPFHLLSDAARPDPGWPLFVVGSGPSLDRDLPHIARLRERAIVVSCGSALGILLERGIRPDLHVENENTWPLVENARRFAARHRLDGIILLASITVRPELGELFGERWFYHRPRLSSSRILGGPARPVPFTGPLVANAAAAAGASLGFRHIHLFGVDCGCRDPRRHHAAGAVYYEPDYDNYIEGENLLTIVEEFSREAPGNFGGTVRTSALTDLSRRALADLLRERRIGCLNCGDGARIEGAVPKAAAALDLALPRTGRAEVLAGLARGLPRFAAGAYLDGIDLAAWVAACRGLRTRLAALLDESERDDATPWDLARRLEFLAHDADPGTRGLLAVIGGSQAALLRLGIHRGVRIAGDAARARFTRRLARLYRDFSLRLLDEAEGLLRAMADRHPDPPPMASL